MSAPASRSGWTRSPARPRTRGPRSSTPTPTPTPTPTGGTGTDGTVSHDGVSGPSSWRGPAGSSYQRGSPWPTRPILPDQLRLPPPRLVLPLELEPDLSLLDPDRPLSQHPPPKPDRLAAR